VEKFLDIDISLDHFGSSGPRVVVADDHALVREGLILKLRQLSPNIHIVEATTFNEVTALLRNRIDLVFLDLHMPGADGLDWLRQVIPTTTARIVVVSGTFELRDIQAAITAGAVGFLSKGMAARSLANALQIILDGGTYVPAEAFLSPSDDVESASRQGWAQKTEQKTASVALTPRQSEVLKYLSQGHMNKQIAYDLGISEATVKLHVNSLFRLLSARNRTQAVNQARKFGLID
jgi:DNA-binding NarL/FixJ family response regulator